MSKLGLMTDRVINPAAIPVLVDLGSVNDKPSRDCADRLMAAGVAKSNFSIEGFARLLVKLPPKKADAIIRRFRFVAGATYFQCTHSRRGIV